MGRVIRLTPSTASAAALAVAAATAVTNYDSSIVLILFFLNVLFGIIVYRVAWRDAS